MVDRLGANQPDIYLKESVTTKPELKGKWILDLNLFGGQKKNSAYLQLIYS